MSKCRYNYSRTLPALLLSFKIFLFSVILVLIAIIFDSMGQQLTSSRKTSLPVHSPSASSIIVIDAGHGGEDGGAVGINGCLEKDINLDIAIELYDLLRLFDVPAVLTRNSDIMLCDDAGTGRKKLQDLKNRLSTLEELEGGILVSIHMNSYPSEKYSGAQVYYSPNNENSMDLAQEIQKELKDILSPNNERQIKPSGSSIYLLHNATKPAVLVECGFISNRKEAELLCTDNYQSRVALTLCSSIIKYLSTQRN